MQFGVRGRNRRRRLKRHGSNSTKVFPDLRFNVGPSIYKKIVKDLVINLGIEEIERSANTIGAYMESSQLKKFLADAKQEDADRKQRSRKR
jgi:hypothetical protein